MKKLFQFFKLRRNVLVEVFFIFFLSLTPLLWFKGNSIMVGHDNIFPLDPVTFLGGRLYTWIEQGFGQSQSLIMGTIPIHIIDAIPTLLGFSLQTTQEIVYVFWFLMMGLSAYVLASVLNKESRVFKLTSVVLYQFNFFILQGWWVGERTKFSAYIAFPLILAIFINVYRKKIGVVKAAIFNSLILFVFNAGGLYGISLYGGMLASLFVFILFFGLVSFYQKQLQNLKRIMLLVLFTMIGFLFVNFYYVMPAVSKIVSQYTTGMDRGGGVSGFIDWASEISVGASYINIFRLQGIAEWYDNPQHPFSKLFLTNPLLIAISFLWPLLVILTLHLYKKKSKLEIIFYFFLSYLVGIFFTAGTHPPFGFVYEQLMRWIPGSAMFRSPYFKFAPSVFLANSFLIAYFVDYFKGNTRKVLFVFIIILTLIYHFPYFTGDFFVWRRGFSTRLTVPKYVFDFGNWLNREKEGNGRVLVVPPNDPNFDYSRYNWGYLSFQSVPTLLSNKSVVINNDRINDDERKMLISLYNAMSNNDKDLTLQLVNLFKISHIVLQNDQYVDKESTFFTDSKTYQKFLTNSDSFLKIKTFGKWDVYEVDQKNLSKISLTNKLHSLNDSLSNIDKYSPFLVSASNFYVRDAITSPFAQNLLEEQSNYFINPVCINCFRKNKPLVIFPDRTILPDSPLYEILALYEKLTLKDSDPKANIYNLLGLSLKRVSEINQQIIEGKELTKDFVDKYNELLKLIVVNFNKLPSLQSKFEVARDADHYLSEERNYLSPNLGTYVRTGSQSKIVDQIFMAISNTEKVLVPYILEENELNNRLYEVSVKNSDTFEMFVGQNELQSVVRDGSSIRAVIDGNKVLTISLPFSSGNERWYSFGKITLAKGMHTILLTFPEVPNSARPFEQKSIEFSKDNTCFATSVDKYNSNKDYKISMRYVNDFSENLLFFIWDFKKEKKQLLDVVKLKNSIDENILEYIIKKADNLNNPLIAICAPNLTQEQIDKKFNLKINELIYPSILFTPQIIKQANVYDLSYRQLSPIKYEVSLNNIPSNKAAILIFSERFDAGWKLREVDGVHFKVDGYANGWVIKNPDGKSIILEYSPDQYFRYGIILSAIAVFCGIVYLVLLIRKKKNYVV